MKPENWIPLGRLPIIDASKSLRPTQGYDESPARNCRLFHEGWKHFLSNRQMFSTVSRVVIYADGFARETMHFIAGLLPPAIAAQQPKFSFCRPSAPLL